MHHYRIEMLNEEMASLKIYNNKLIRYSNIQKLCTVNIMPCIIIICSV